MKKNTFLIIVSVFLFFGCCDEEKISYESSWDSVSKHPDPEWFRDAKFGIYFHWGPYTVAGQGAWYPRNMYIDGHEDNKYHLENYGNLKEFGYKDFIPMLTAENWDPVYWAKLFKKAGARFAGPVAEHADGFAMWDSELTDWCAGKMGPKRDIVGEMEKAVRAEGMKFMASFHHQYLYAWYPTMDTTTDASNPKYEDLYGPAVPTHYFNICWDEGGPKPDSKFHDRWLSRTIEVVDKYKPDLVWFDNRCHIIDGKTKTDFLSYYYNAALKWEKDVVATYKSTDFAFGSGILDKERSRMSDIKPYPWLTDDSIDWEYWSWAINPQYKTTNRLIDFLVDVVSKNGCVLLNVPPTADGRIPVEVEEKLLEMGEWLRINGDAIYETRPWKIYGQGPLKVVEGLRNEEVNPDATAEDIRFTTKDGVLYAIVLDWPEDGVSHIKKLSSWQKDLGKISTIKLLGSNEEIKWERDENGLHIYFPKEKPCEYAYSFAIVSDKLDLF